MTKEVLITISGLHYDEDIISGEESVPIEVITPATYYYKNGKHYILFEELVEGIPGTIRNRIKIKEGEMLEITKSGITNTHMLFEKGKINVTPYETPYGEIIVGTYTRELDVNVQEKRIDICVRYSLDVSGEKIAECDIRIQVDAKEG